MKTLNEDIKRMLDLMGAQHGVIYPLINEQNNEFWDNLLKGDLKAANWTSSLTPSPLINPDTGSEVLIQLDKSSNDNFPCYIGCNITSHYRPTGKMYTPGVNNDSQSLRFYCSISFYITRDQNDMNGQQGEFVGQGWMFLKGNNDFVKSIEFEAKSDHLKKSLIDKNTNKTISSVQKFVALKLAKNLAGCLGSTFLGKINSELENIGFPPITDATITVKQI